MNKKLVYSVVCIIGLIVMIGSWYILPELFNHYLSFVALINKDESWRISIRSLFAFLGLLLYIIILLLVERHQYKNTEQHKQKKLAKLKEEIRKLEGE